MPLDYDHDSRLKALSPVLDEHAEWFGRVIRQVFYPEQKMSQGLLAAPESFDNWARDAQRDEAVESATLTRMRRLHDDMRQTAAFLLKEAAGSGYKPEVKYFDSFVTLYDEFHAHIRRLERDLAMSDSGLDALTGLRSRKVMNKDIERELERRSRRGRPFCLALARIDHYEDIKNMPQAEHDRLMVAASEIIKLCIRSFDDAYRMNDGEFLMCMKQTEMSGGSAGLNRLKKLLEERAPFFNLGGKEIHLTMSSCVAEPQPGDQVDELIANMRKDLNRFGGDAETALEYFEISPLQRFVTGLDDGSDNKPH
ncbi:MAG: diguanylate cyclase domain-containing protein [Micavibrio sp.]